MYLIKYTINRHNVNVYVDTNRDLIQIFNMYKDYINLGDTYVGAIPSPLV